MKKKKRLTVKKGILYFFVALIIIVGLFALNAKQLQKTPNSFKNTGYYGNALFYDTLKALGYQVSYEMRPISQLKAKGLVVLNVATKNYNLSEIDIEQIFDYVENGGKILVVALNSDSLPTPDQSKYESVPSSGLYMQWITDSGGILMYGDIYSISNITLSTDREVSYGILEDLHPHINKEGIVFNEYFLFVQDGERSLWREIPGGVKATLYQLLLVFIVFIGYKGKRFGAPRILYEESEPDEHQYAKAVGELYYQAGHWEVLIDAYYHQLLNKVYRKHLLYSDINESNWIQAFEHNKNHKVAQKVFHFMEQYYQGVYKNFSKKKRNKKIKEILVHIQNLEKSLEQ